MKEFVARAMQMSYLNPEQIEQIHLLELTKNYLIPNWNIQKLLNVPSIKEKYNLNDETLPSHVIRIENELRFKFKPQFNGADESSLEWIHALDWAISRQGSLIIWEYARQRGKGSFISKVKNLEVVD